MADKMPVDEKRFSFASAVDTVMLYDDGVNQTDRLEHVIPKDGTVVVEDNAAHGSTKREITFDEEFLNNFKFTSFQEAGRLHLAARKGDWDPARSSRYITVTLRHMEDIIKLFKTKYLYNNRYRLCQDLLANKPRKAVPDDLKAIYQPDLKQIPGIFTIYGAVPKQLEDLVVKVNETFWTEMKIYYRNAQDVIDEKLVHRVNKMQTEVGILDNGELWDIYLEARERGKKRANEAIKRHKKKHMKKQEASKSISRDGSGQHSVRRDHAHGQRNRGRPKRGYRSNKRD